MKKLTLEIIQDFFDRHTYKPRLRDIELGIKSWVLDVAVRIWDIFMIYQEEKYTDHYIIPAGWNLRQSWCWVVVGLVTTALIAILVFIP